MKTDALKKLVMELELTNEFDDIEAEACSICCGVGDGGNSGC